MSYARRESSFTDLIRCISLFLFGSSSFLHSFICVNVASGSSLNRKPYFFCISDYMLTEYSSWKEPQGADRKETTYPVTEGSQLSYLYKLMYNWPGDMQISHSRSFVFEGTLNCPVPGLSSDLDRRKCWPREPTPQAASVPFQGQVLALEKGG